MVSSSTKRKKREIIPRFGGGLLAESHSVADNGKINLHGVFTRFLAWGFPCNRHCIAAITLFNLPKGKTTILLSLKKRGSSETSILTTAEFEIKQSNGASTVPVPLNFLFEKSGAYEVVCTFANYKGSLKIPFLIELEEWPIFTQDEINFVQEKQNVPKSLRANVHCKDCSHAYIFEENILSGERPIGGVYRFPESGVFECVECGHIMNLKDIQGQLRASIKSLIKKMMERAR